MEVEAVVEVEAEVEVEVEVVVEEVEVGVRLRTLNETVALSLLPALSLCLAVAS
jgi:hypothetical protein